MIVALAGCDRAFGLERNEQPAGDWAAVAAGARHTCGVRLDGTLWCWGMNEFQQVGGDAPEQPQPTQLGTGSWRTITSFFNHTCGIQSDGSLWCWGLNNYGQLGQGHFGIVVEPKLVPGGPWTTVATGWFHTCGIQSDGSLWCWGSNFGGQLGDGTKLDQFAPARIGSGTGWTGVATGFTHTCGIQSDETLWCWGKSDYGELADPNSVSELAPHRVIGSWTSVAVGSSHTCARSTDGSVRCWGDNPKGQLGNGTTTRSVLGVPVGGNEANWDDLFSGLTHTCGLRADGSLWCWGDNTRGAVPSTNAGVIASLPARLTPVAPSGYASWDGTWISVGLGERHTCAVDEDHRLWCSGGDESGQLGRSADGHLGPSLVEGQWTDIDVGPGFTCALDTAKEARCWGTNTYTELGDASGLDQQTPTPILAAGPWDALTVGATTGCVRRGASHWCWGYNTSGQLGNELKTSYAIPKEIVGQPWPSTATYHTCGTEASGDLWCWGANGTGQAGVGGGELLVPARVAAPTFPWMRVEAGGSHSCGVNSDGLYCWGDNTSGQLGIDPLIPMRNVPALVSTTYPEVITAGDKHTCAIHAEMLTCWGSNDLGQLGNGTTTASAAPLPVTGRWREVSAGLAHSCGITSTGALACWGLNNYGQLGDGTFSNRLQPTTIGSETDWEQVVAANYHSCARKRSGELWCWGANYAGQLGDGRAWSTALELVP